MSHQTETNILKDIIMTTINYLGTELDSTKEYELFLNNNLGLDITVEYTPEAWRSKQGHSTEVFHNRTEFHWRFNQDSGITEKESAFESDILGTGCTRKISEIKSVKIEYATKVLKTEY